MSISERWIRHYLYLDVCVKVFNKITRFDIGECTMTLWCWLLCRRSNLVPNLGGTDTVDTSIKGLFEGGG